METDNNEIGLGPTKELSLRVSIAALASVLFKNPINGKTMLALERTATLQTIGGMSEIIVKAKPFGGGVKLLNPDGLQKLIGKFNYDSERSYKEQDFRIMIRQDSWEKIKDICRKHMNVTKERILEPGPERELKEEFMDCLGIIIKPDDYHLQPKGMVIENLPDTTDNINARGFLTVRIYYLFEAILKNHEIINIMLNNSSEYSDMDLQKMVLENARLGGKGRANAILTLQRDELIGFYNSIPPDKRGTKLNFRNHQLDGNVQAILEEISISKYRHFIS
jgi:hypothetical protein